MPQKEQKRKQNDKLRYIIRTKEEQKEKKSFTKVQVINQKHYYNKTVRKPEKLNNKAKK